MLWFQILETRKKDIYDIVMESMAMLNINCLPPKLTIKHMCVLMIPIWLLWTYLAYLLVTSSRKDLRYKMEYMEYSLNESMLIQLQTEFLIKIEENINGAQIRRIFQYLGATGDRTKNITTIVKQNSSETFRHRTASVKKQSCKSVSEFIEGRLRPDLSSHNLTLVTPSPLPCVSRHKVAVVIPYRDREEHLVTLLNTLHPLLYRQQVQYRIYVVEQFGNDTFNKGVLMNAGVRESLRDGDFGCFVFHDVDLIPEDDRNMYTCPHMPRHMSVAVDKFNYTLPYALLVGGVFSVRLDHFLAVNGYSNLYWGWGGEDDDMAYRIKYRKLEIIRPPETIARYSMIKHDHRPESPNAIRTALLRMAKKRSSRDGLNTVKYRVVWRRDSPSHTHLMIDIGRNHRWHFMDSQQRLVINF